MGKRWFFPIREAYSSVGWLPVSSLRYSWDRGVIGVPEGIKSQPFGHLGEIVYHGPALSGRKDAKADPLCSTARPRMHTWAGGEGVLC